MRRRSRTGFGHATRPEGNSPGRRDMVDPQGEPSGRKCAGHVVIGGRGLVAGDGRVVDDDEAAGEEGEPAAHAHTGNTQGACGAGDGGARETVRGPAGSGDHVPGRTSDTSESPIGL